MHLGIVLLSAHSPAVLLSCWLCAILYWPVYRQWNTAFEPWAACRARWVGANLVRIKDSSESWMLNGKTCDNIIPIEFGAKEKCRIFYWSQIGRFECAQLATWYRYVYTQGACVWSTEQPLVVENEQISAACSQFLHWFFLLDSCAVYIRWILAFCQFHQPRLSKCSSERINSIAYMCGIFSISKAIAFTLNASKNHIKCNPFSSNP